MTRRLLFLNGLAILAVVVYHASGWGFTGMFWWTDRYLPVTELPDFSQMYTLSYWVLRLIEQFIIFGVAAFLFVSGFFVAFAAGRNRASVGWQFIKGRLRFLIFPYLFWSILMLFAEFLQREPITFWDALRRLALGQAAPGFYFVPVLCQFYILSPLLVPLAKNHGKVLLVIAALLQITAQLFMYADILENPLPGSSALSILTASWFFAGNIFWFVLGMVTGFHHQSFKLLLARFRWVLLAALVILLPLGMVEAEVLLRLSGQSWISPFATLLDNVYAVIFIFCYLAFDQIVYPLSKEIMDLGGKSFGIYLAHSLALIFLAKVIYNFMPWVLQWQVIFQPLLIIGGLGIPLLLMALVKNSPVKRIYEYQFG